MMKGFATRASQGGGPTAPRAHLLMRRLVQGETQEQTALGAFKTALAKLENPQSW